VSQGIDAATAQVRQGRGCDSCVCAWREGGWRGPEGCGMGACVGEGVVLTLVLMWAWTFAVVLNVGEYIWTWMEFNWQSGQQLNYITFMDVDGVEPAVWTTVELHKWKVGTKLVKDHECASYARMYEPTHLHMFRVGQGCFFLYTLHNGTS